MIIHIGKNIEISSYKEMISRRKRCEWKAVCNPRSHTTTAMKRVAEIEAHDVKRDIISDATFATGNDSNPILIVV